MVKIDARVKLRHLRCVRHNKMVQDSTVKTQIIS